MHESISLVDKAVFSVKNFRVSGKHNVLNNVSVLVHLGFFLIVILAFPYPLSCFLLFELLLL